MRANRIQTSSECTELCTGQFRNSGCRIRRILILQREILNTVKRRSQRLSPVNRGFHGVHFHIRSSTVSTIRCIVKRRETISRIGMPRLRVMNRNLRRGIRRRVRGGGAQGEACGGQGGCSDAREGPLEHALHNCSPILSRMGVVFGNLFSVIALPVLVPPTHPEGQRQAGKLSGIGAVVTPPRSCGRHTRRRLANSQAAPANSSTPPPNNR